MKNNSGHFFSYYRVWQTSGNILLGSIRYYGNRCASYKIISVTPNKLLKTQFFEKKSYFSGEKVFSAYFFLYYRVRQTSVSFYKGRQCFLTVIGQFIRSFLKDLRGRWKPFLKKKLFSRRKNILVIFFSCYREWQTSGNILLGFTRY